LAALVFMAIVIPAAVEGLRVANLAGQLAIRKATAARIAERVMNELIVTGQAEQGGQTHTIQDGSQWYRCLARTEPWSFGSMQLMTVEVSFPVQGRDCSVRLSTLVESATTR
jgi:hypothetical protein